MTGTTKAQGSKAGRPSPTARADRERGTRQEERDKNRIAHRELPGHDKRNKRGEQNYRRLTTEPRRQRTRLLR